MGVQSSGRWVFVVASLFTGSVYAVDASTSPVMQPQAETVTAPPAAPAGPTPAWMDPQVVKAAIQIGLDPQQQPEFRRIVGEYLTNLRKVVQQEMRRESVNKDRTIKRKNNGLIKKMDEQVKPLLSAEQWPKYEQYKTLLFAKMKEASPGA